MISLGFRQLQAWSPALVDLPEATPPHQYTSTEKYLAKKLNAGAARRFSQLTKLSVDLGLLVSENENVDHVVFSSRHGELTNATELLSMAGRGEILSPTLFSQSVHNTAIGSLTLLQKNNAATTSLAAGPNSFMMGLVSCAIYLKENPNSQVLYISADESVPPIFNLEEKNIPYGTAMLLTQSLNGQSIAIDGPHKEITLEETNLPQGIRFLRWFYSRESSIRLSGGTFSWNLKRY